MDASVDVVEKVVAEQDFAYNQLVVLHVGAHVDNVVDIADTCVVAGVAVV